MLDLQELLARLALPATVCILPHNNPDPDALAAALGLKLLLERRTPCRVRLVFGGIISRRNNREMVRLLEIPLIPASTPGALEADHFCLVDCQPGAGNNPLPEDVIPLLVLDHHPPPEVRRPAHIEEIQLTAGSTSAMVGELLVASDLVPETNLATALYYGIKTDTDGLARDASDLDRAMFQLLFPLIDPVKLAGIEKPDLPRTYYQDIGDAVMGARLHESVLVADLGTVWSPEMPAEMADFFLRMEGVEAVLAYGLYEQRVFFSLRHRCPGFFLGDLAVDMVRGFGAAGGHRWSAGGTFPYDDATLAEVRRRFFAAFEHDEAAYLPLLEAAEDPLAGRTGQPQDR